MPTPITDPADPRLTDFVGLTDVALRRRTEPERGLYIAESEKVIRRALAAGHRPRSYLMAARWLTDLADLVERAEADGIPVYVGEHDVIESLTGFHLHRGALAAMQRPVLPTSSSVLAGARRVLVLEDVVDHTNVGAVFRSAAALGVDAVLVTPRCADPLYRRSIRVSMGTVFQVPWTRIDPWPGGVRQLHELGFVVAALALADDSVGLDALAADPPERLALVLGTEGDGLSRRTHGGGRPDRADPDGRGSGLAQRGGGRCRGGLGAAGAGLRSTVRIVVSGTHASGKSTLVSDLAAALRCEQLPDPFELVDDDLEPGGAGVLRAAAGARRGAPRRAARRCRRRGRARPASTSSPTSRPWPTSVDRTASADALDGLRVVTAAAMATSTCSSCSRSRCPTSSRCPTTRTPTCGTAMDARLLELVDDAGAWCGDDAVVEVVRLARSSDSTRWSPPSRGRQAGTA